MVGNLFLPPPLFLPHPKTPSLHLHHHHHRHHPCALLVSACNAMRRDKRPSSQIWSFGSTSISTQKLQGAFQNLMVLMLSIQITFFGTALPANSYEQPSPDFGCMDETNYYQSADGLQGKNLKKQLHNIIKGHHSVSYAKVWNALKILDASDVDNPESSPYVVEIYAQRIVSKDLASKAEGWNREHLWPRSYGLTEGRPEFTDLHNIRPSDANVNFARGNKFYGECNLKKKATCLVPANPEAALDTSTDKRSWTPPTKVRGDIARALMYMAVRYGIGQPDNMPRLKLSNFPSRGLGKTNLDCFMKHIRNKIRKHIHPMSKVKGKCAPQAKLGHHHLLPCTTHDFSSISQCTNGDSLYFASLE